jgi:hypothetical protein
MFGREKEGVCHGHPGSIVLEELVVHGQLNDGWLFPLGRARGICPTDAHPHPDPCVRSQPTHGLQSTLQSEPKTVSTCTRTRPGQWAARGSGFSAPIRGLPSLPDLASAQS